MLHYSLSLREDGDNLISNMRKVSHTKSPENMVDLILSYKN